MGSSNYELKDWMICEDEKQFCPFCHSEMYRIDEITYQCQNETCWEVWENEQPK